MTNFLTRLVGRTLGTMPLVQPRIASMYEEQGSRGAGEQVSRGEGEFAPSFMPNSLRFSQMPTEVSPLGKAGREISAQAISTNLADKDLPNNSELSADFVEDELTIKTRSNIKSRAGETPTPQEFLEGTRAGETPTPQEFLEGTRAGETPTPQEFLQRSSCDKVESMLVRQEPLSAMSPKITTKVDRDVENNERKAMSLSEEIAAIPESNHPKLKQNFPNPNSGRDEEIGKPPITHHQLPITNYQLPITQTIKVSIGRIEVRAIPAPPAAPAPRKSMPTPKLSLSDYLRQHGGGG